MHGHLAVVRDVVDLEGHLDLQHVGVGGQDLPRRVDLHEVGLSIFRLLTVGHRGDSQVSVNVPRLVFSFFFLEAECCFQMVKCDKCMSENHMRNIALLQIYLLSPAPGPLSPGWPHRFSSSPETESRGKMTQCANLYIWWEQSYTYIVIYMCVSMCIIFGRWSH